MACLKERFKFRGFAAAGPAGRGGGSVGKPSPSGRGSIDSPNSVQRTEPESGGRVVTIGPKKIKGRKSVIFWTDYFLVCWLVAEVHPPPMVPRSANVPVLVIEGRPPVCSLAAPIFFADSGSLQTAPNLPESSRQIRASGTIENRQKRRPADGCRFSACFLPRRWAVERTTPGPWLNRNRRLAKGFFEGVDSGSAQAVGFLHRLLYKLSSSENWA